MIRSRQAKKSLVRVYYDDTGKRKFTGIPKKLKKSQEYPLAFGKEATWLKGILLL